MEGGGGGWLVFSFSGFNNPLPVTSLGGAMATNRTTPLGSDLMILSALALVSLMSGTSLIESKMSPTLHDKKRGRER